MCYIKYILLYILYMKSTYNIPDKLLKEAMKSAHASTKTQAIIIALSELIERRKSAEVLSLKGSMKADLDYKALRKKR